MGLWLIQECRRDWAKKTGTTYSWNDIVKEAEAAEPLRTIINPDYADFFSGGDMVRKIQDYCRKIGQPVPETVGQVARAIYESLALKYRWALERLEEIKGEEIQQLNIVGGGIQNKLLNQMDSGRQIHLPQSGYVRCSCKRSYSYHQLSPWR